MIYQCWNRDKQIPTTRLFWTRWILTGVNNGLSIHSLDLAVTHHAHRVGFVTFEDYMSFMISRETDNVQSMAEVVGAFRAITARGEKPYVTREDLLQVSSMPSTSTHDVSLWYYNYRHFPLSKQSTALKG